MQMTKVWEEITKDTMSKKECHLRKQVLPSTLPLMLGNLMVQLVIQVAFLAFPQCFPFGLA